MSASRRPEWHRFISHNCIACRAWLKTAAVKRAQWDSFPWLERQGFPALSFWVLELPKQGRAVGLEKQRPRASSQRDTLPGEPSQNTPEPGWEAACRGDTRLAARVWAACRAPQCYGGPGEPRTGPPHGPRGRRGGCELNPPWAEPAEEWG